MKKNRPILRLPIERYWFDKIASGEKKKEFREYKPYWIVRLQNHDGSFKIFSEIWFTAGYGKDKPFMRVEWVDCNLTINAFSSPFRGEQFEIHLGEILEIKNWEVSKDGFKKD